jgi:flagellar FliL protein
MATASPAATAASVTDAAPPAKGKKKLIIIVGLALLVLAIGAAAAVLLLKKKPVDPDAEGEAAAPAHSSAAQDAKAVPVFVPLDAFTVNLADRDAERYAQVGITLEIEDSHVADRIKAFMPAIRNNILMLLSDRTAADLQGRDGKLQLADQIRREASRALGYAVADEGQADAGSTARRKKKAAPALPVKAVHFSNFIIQ